MTDHPSRTLATFAAQLHFDSIPHAVVERTVNLYVDWLGSALAGKGARPVETIARFARQASGGLADGPCEILIDRSRATPYFAAMVNGAASHFAEQDDVHNGSVFHPATVVFPVALALAQASHASGREFIAAAVAGYEVGIRIGEFLGRSHYKVFHTTGTAGTVAAAAAAGRLLGLIAGSNARRFRFGGYPGERAVGVSARCRRLETTAHRDGRRQRPDGRPTRRRRFQGRDAHSRRRAGHGCRHVERRGSGASRRPAGPPLGDRGDVVQVSRGLPSHAPGCGRVARRGAGTPTRAAARSRRSSRTCIKAQSMCSARSSRRARCIRRSSTWARCWASSRITAMRA